MHARQGIQVGDACSPRHLRREKRSRTGVKPTERGALDIKRHLNFQPTREKKIKKKRKTNKNKKTERRGRKGEYSTTGTGVRPYAADHGEEKTGDSSQFDSRPRIAAIGQTNVKALSQNQRFKKGKKNAKKGKKWVGGDKGNSTGKKKS